MTVTRFLARVVGVALAVGGFAVATSAAQHQSTRPVATITQRLIMIQGRAAVPVEDLARAIGGVLEPAAEAGSYAIRSGAAGALRFDPSGRRRAGLLSRQAAGGEPGTVGATVPWLTIDGVPACQGIVLQGRQPYVLLDELASLFGGVAVFDAARGQWGIRGAAPGSLLSFK